MDTPKKPLPLPAVPGSVTRYLTVPTTPPTIIPLGMSRDDFAMLNLTLGMWEHHIAPLPVNDRPVEEFCGILADDSQNIPTVPTRRADQ